MTSFLSANVHPNVHISLCTPFIHTTDMHVHLCALCVCLYLTPDIERVNAKEVQIYTCSGYNNRGRDGGRGRESIEIKQTTI